MVYMSCETWSILLPIFLMQALRFSLIFSFDYIWTTDEASAGQKGTSNNPIREKVEIKYSDSERISRKECCWISGIQFVKDMHRLLLLDHLICHFFLDLWELFLLSTHGMLTWLDIDHLMYVISDHDLSPLLQYKEHVGKGSKLCQAQRPHHVACCFWNASPVHYCLAVSSIWSYGHLLNVQMDQLQEFKVDGFWGFNKAPQVPLGRKCFTSILAFIV